MRPEPGTGTVDCQAGLPRPCTRPALYDHLGRQLDYLRISVTDRCNLRCAYCMPEGCQLIDRADILSFEEMLEVAQSAVSLGFCKLRITGGEPLVRRGIVDFVAMLAALTDVNDLAMTTNGTLLTRYARPLRAAGLMRLNVSLDTVNAAKYSLITGGGRLNAVMAGLKSARDAGFDQIKLNCVIEESSNELDALAVKAFAAAEGYEARFIHRMNLTRGEFWPVEGGSGGDCAACNRLRLSADGLIRPCLFSDLAFSVRELGPRRALTQAALMKPESGQSSRIESFNAIGG